MSKLASKLYFKAFSAKNKVIDFLKKENGEANIIAIVLVLAIVIALAIIFREQIMGLFNKIWASLFEDVDQVIS